MNHHPPTTRLADLVSEPAYFAQVLEDAANFDDSNWTQGPFFQDDHGNQLDHFDQSATRWATGAYILKATGRNQDHFRRIMRIFDVVLSEMTNQPYRHINYWCDAPGRAPAEVKALLLETAARLRREAADTPAEE